jgi:hypothetical protein
MRAAIGIAAATALAATTAVTPPLWEPPAMWANYAASAPTGTRDFVPRLKIGSLTVVLEETPLLDVGTRFGASVGQRGDAGDSLEWVCFQGQDERGPWVLWLESGEIHGPTVGGVLLKRRAASEQVDARCVRLAATPISMPLPVHLGMPRSELLHLLGRPTSESGQSVVYSNCHSIKLSTKKGREPEPFDLCSSLRVRFRAGTLDALEVWRTTTS